MYDSIHLSYVRHPIFSSMARHSYMSGQFSIKKTSWKEILISDPSFLTWCFYLIDNKYTLLLWKVWLQAIRIKGSILHPNSYPVSEIWANITTNQKIFIWRRKRYTESGNKLHWRNKYLESSISRWGIPTKDL
jgi:hypothetical protein